MKWKADQFCFFQETKIISRKSFSHWIYFLVHCLKIKRCPATDKVYQRNFLCLSFKTEPKIRILVILWYRQFVTHHNSRRLFLLMTVKENTVVKLKACGKGMCEGIKGNKSRKKRKIRDFSNTKLIQLQPSCWFTTDSVLGFTKKVIRFQNTVSYRPEWLFVTRAGKLSPDSP